MEYYHLTTPQKNIFNLQKYYADTAISNLCGAIIFKEKRKSENLQQAIFQFIKSQSGIRLRFCQGEEPKQYVSEEIECDFPVLEFSFMEELDDYAEKFAKEPLELMEQKMYRFAVFHLKDRSGILVLLSHLVADAWTFGLMAKRLDEASREIAKGEDISLEQADYIQYIQAEKQYFDSERYQKDEAYWEERYAERPEKSEVKLHSMPLVSIEAKRITKMLPLVLEQNINSFCKENSVTPAVLFETAIIIYLSKINQENRTVTIGIPVLNRSNAKEKNIAGMFISTMPLTVELEKDMSVLELAKKISKGHMDVFRHQKYPYTSILEMLRNKQNFSGNLYDVMVSYQNAKTDADADTKWYTNGYSEVPLVIHIDNRDNKECHTLNVDYQTELFSEEEVQYLIKRLEYILVQMKEHNTTIGDISIVPLDERKKVIEEFNKTAVEYPRDKCVHELFEEQARKTPEEVALIFQDKRFTYRKLNQMSNAFAYFLRENGVRRGSRIAVLLKRDENVVIVQLAVLKLGAIFIPIDNRYPNERIDYIMRESKADLLIRNVDKDISINREININDLRMKLVLENVFEKGNPEDACYIIFTSGSTGKPKGCTLTNRGLVNFCKNNNILDTCNRLEKKIAVSVNTISFDFFIAESLLPLLNGFTVVLASEEESLNQEKFIDLVKRNNVNIIQTTPTRYRLFFDERCDISYIKQFDVLVTSGEALTLDLLQTFCVNQHAKIFNPLGPSECSVWVVGGELHCEGGVKDSTITIGKPIANTQIYILDSHSVPVPIGIPGELCIAGDGVGLGYLNRPDLTAERFVPNPFRTEKNGHGETLYHTGDLASWKENGEIEYLGRIDTQVKIRGLRIELGEIESVMAAFPDISMCAVADKKDDAGRQYLVGYYTTAPDENAITSALSIDEKALREHLSAKLPRYMIPNYFVRLDKLPMTPSGKLDRKNLPMPKMFEMDATEYVEPITNVQKRLCRAMEEVLDYAPIGLTHDFFAYGGDSLKAIELIVKLEGMGYQVKLQGVFEYPIVADFARLLQGAEADTKAPIYNAEQFAKYNVLLKRNNQKEDYKVAEVGIKTILLSGITGFLGAHVANALLQDEECVVYCLVRSLNAQDRRGRFPEILEYYFGDKYKEVIGTRIIPIVGDITEELLSEKLPEKVDMVIHAAATVKHYGAYEYFYKVNTLGTKNMAAYAQRVGAKFIHISTVTVSGKGLTNNYSAEAESDEKIFNEGCLYQNQTLKNVYVRSKFEAECMVLDAMLQGLQANIIRVGNLTNRSKDYMFQPNYKENAFLSRIKAVMELGCLPDYLLPLSVEFSPVDDTADAIVRIARHFNMEHTIFHVYSNQNLYFNRMLEIWRELYIPMEVVQEKEFAERLKGTIEDRPNIYEAFMNDVDERGRLQFDANIHIQNDFTISYLKQLGFTWTKIDYEYVKGYITYFQKMQYFEKGMTDEE